tara:strand:+ start:502 stop:909 length:408 start_codon:yes stop_codon:yes gene_type:complete
MNFTDAIKSVLVDNYFGFEGRARRSEFNYWVLFECFIGLGFGIITAFLEINANNLITELNLINWIQRIQIIIILLFFVPRIAVIVRRLHDTNKSPWFILMFIPGFYLLIPAFIFIYWTMFQEGDPDSNKYGEPVK